MKPTVIDLFCGAGGLSFGFSEAGFNILLGIDNDPESRETFLKNHPGASYILKDIHNVSEADIIKGIGNRKIDVLIGGPPCQGFSIAGKRKSDDPRNTLYGEFIRFIKILQPKVFVMENVPRLLSIDGGKFKEKIVSEFKQCGYSVGYKTLYSSDYGVPQIRKRVFFIGLRENNLFEFPEPMFGKGKLPYITSEEAISDLPEETLQEGTGYLTKAKSDYQKKMRAGSMGVFNHVITVHTDKTKRIIALVPDGGNYKNLPENLQDTRKVNIAWTRLNSRKPSFTIDTGHNHHFHYKYNRVPTARESARIQSFPDRFIFYGKKTTQLRQIGNAVPPLLAKAFAEHLKKQL